MSYKNHLETRIRNVYSFIREHRKIIDVSTRPEEKYNSRERIRQHWRQIEHYLQEYLVICRHQRERIPEDIGEMVAARFPDLHENIDCTRSSKEYNSPSPTSLDSRGLMESIGALETYQQVLKEWKEIHHLLQETITSLTPLIGVLELAFRGTEEWDPVLGIHLWRQTRIQLRKLESFSKDIECIDEPFDDSRGELRGARWMVEIAALQNELDSILREEGSPIGYDLALELSDTCFTHLYRADKHLRDTVNELCKLSTSLKGYWK